MSAHVPSRRGLRLLSAAMVTSLVASLTVGAPAAVAATGDSEPHTGNGCGSPALTLEA
ncbi:hypothetical protein [Microbispora sp. NPDC049125]|uniref:hypothetical protein n=1 Tax=Microbispora sp. NPDC049125 TaxID=3154929 RepID=UPI00346675F8